MAIATIRRTSRSGCASRGTSRTRFGMARLAGCRRAKRSRISCTALQPSRITPTSSTSGWRSAHASWIGTRPSDSHGWMCQKVTGPASSPEAKRRDRRSRPEASNGEPRRSRSNGSQVAVSSGIDNLILLRTAGLGAVGARGAAGRRHVGRRAGIAHCHAGGEVVLLVRRHCVPTLSPGRARRDHRNVRVACEPLRPAHPVCDGRSDSCHVSGDLGRDARRSRNVPIARWISSRWSTTTSSSRVTSRSGSSRSRSSVPDVTGASFFRRKHLVERR